MKDICEAAGLSRGGLYTHYGSTGQVFADIIEELMSGLESQVAGKMERGLPAALILDELLERYQSEMLDRSGSLGLAFYEYYSGLPLTEDNAMLKQYYSSKTMLCSLIEYGIGKGEFRQAHADAVSYTHLDVYKRQVYKGICITAGKQGPSSLPDLPVRDIKSLANGQAVWIFYLICPNKGRCV